MTLRPPGPKPPAPPRHGHRQALLKPNLIPNYVSPDSHRDPAPSSATATAAAATTKYTKNTQRGSAGTNHAKPERKQPSSHRKNDRHDCGYRHMTHQEKMHRTGHAQDYEHERRDGRKISREDTNRGGGKRNQKSSLSTRSKLVSDKNGASYIGPSPPDRRDQDRLVKGRSSSSPDSETNRSTSVEQGIRSRMMRSSTRMSILHTRRIRSESKTRSVHYRSLS